ncbi:hypothetical protein [uncultured Victivallis sp.]|nr:hypothetical protein [uncultured Victivallis sp.]
MRTPQGRRRRKNDSEERCSTWSWFPAGTAKVTLLDETGFAGHR